MLSGRHRREARSGPVSVAFRRLGARLVASRRCRIGGCASTVPASTTDLDLLRLQGSTVTDHGDHLVVRTEANPTFWWGNFVLVPTAARSDEVDRWTARFEEEFPDAHHRAIGFAQPGGDTEAWAASGWDVEGDVDLATTSVPVAADAPDGIRLAGARRPTTTGSSRRRSAAATPRRRTATAASSSSADGSLPSAASSSPDGPGGSGRSTVTGSWRGSASCGSATWPATRRS